MGTTLFSHLGLSTAVVPSSKIKKEVNKRISLYFNSNKWENLWRIRRGRGRRTRETGRLTSSWCVALWLSSFPVDEVLSLFLTSIIFARIDLANEQETMRIGTDKNSFLLQLSYRWISFERKLVASNLATQHCQRNIFIVHSCAV